MTKIVLNNVASFQNDSSAAAIVNNNMAAISAAFDNTLSRDGTSPNQMGSDLDANSHRIINLPAPSSSHEPVRLVDIQSGTVSVDTSYQLQGDVTTPLGSGVQTATVVKINGGSLGTTTPTSGNVLVGSGTAWQTQAVSGDVTMTSGGVTAIGSNKVTNAKMATMSANTIKANNTGGSAAPTDITGTQTTAMLDTFTSSLKGLAPASGGGTANYLRADGTWTAPSPGLGTLVSAFPNSSPNGRNNCRDTARSAFPLLMQDNTIRICGAGSATLYYTMDSQGNNVPFPRNTTFAVASLPLTGTISKVFTSDGSHYALSSDGKVYSAGNNTSGQLGLGDTTSRYQWNLITYFTSNSLTVTNIFVPDSSEDAAAGVGTALFLVNGGGDTGRLYAVGYGTQGQLGNGAGASSSTPVRVGTLTNIQGAVISSSIYGHCIAWDSNGFAYTWGYNPQGQLGNGNTTTQNSPFTVTGTGSAPSHLFITGAAAGFGDYATTPRGCSFLMSSDGYIWACGYNGTGQLGINSTTSTSVFTSCTGNPLNPISITTNPCTVGNTIFLTSGGQIWGTGANVSGELGLNNGKAQVTVFTRAGSITGCTKVYTTGQGVTGNCSSYAIISGVPYACGYATNGGLGLGGTTAADSFTQVPVPHGYESDTVTDMASFGYGSQHITCWLCTSGRVLVTGHTNWSSGSTGSINNYTATTTFQLSPMILSTY